MRISIIICIILLKVVEATRGKYGFRCYDCSAVAQADCKIAQNLTRIVSIDYNH